jgi:hypothetical protein
VPLRSSGAFSVQDDKTGMEFRIRVRGSLDAVAEAARGALVYAGGHEFGDMILRPSASGVEDYVVVKHEGTSRLEYEVALNPKVAGLRLLSDTLELLDHTGDPRLRVAPPYLVDAKGVMRFAKLGVTGCNYDTNTSTPWGRPVTAPRSSSCQISVSWDPAGLSYPILVDPSWTSTQHMAVARRSHVTSQPSYPSNKVLVAGGRTGSFTHFTAEIYSFSTETWAAAAPMTTARYQAVHMNRVLGTGQVTSDDYVLVAGGQNASTGYIASAERYRFLTGTWHSAGSMTHGRYDAAAASPDIGQVLITGGSTWGTSCQLIPCTVAQTERYDFATNAWTPNLPQPSSPRYTGHTLTRLSPGFGPSDLLRVGGNGNGNSFANEKWIQSSGTWTTNVANLNKGVVGHSAVLCDGCSGSFNNKVFVMGGVTNAGSPIATIQYYNPGSPGSWTTWGNMTGARYNHSSLLFTDPGGNRRILIAGGENTIPVAGQIGGNTIKTAWVWPTGSVPDMKFGRSRFGMVRGLSSGKVLVTGGFSSITDNSIYECDLYTP